MDCETFALRKKFLEKFYEDRVKEEVKNKLNLLKHKHPFELYSTGRDVFESYNIRYSAFLYKTKKIQNGATIDIYSIDDLFKKIKPFLLYVMSMSNTKTIQGYQLFNGLYKIVIKFYNEYYYHGFTFIRMISFEIDYGNDLNFSDIDLLEYDESRKKYFQEPFEIHIDAYNYYKTVLVENESKSEDEPEDESESEDEPEDEPEEEIPLIKTFNEDKCIICLENKPNI